MIDTEIKYADICRAGTTVMKDGKAASLHPYQQKAKSDIFASWDEVKHVMLQMPTGTGKTYLFTSIMDDITRWSRETHTPTKILVIAHRRELIEQIDRSLGVFGVPHSVFAGPKQLRNLSNPVLVSSIQTITHKANEADAIRLRDRIRFVIIDEAHHAMADSYRKLWKMFPEARFLGVTATPWRMNHSGFWRIFNRLILTQPVKAFIKQGYLAPYDYYSLKYSSDIQRSINSIRRFDKWGDYEVSALQETMDLGHIRAQLVKSYRKLAWGKKGIIYSINKAHSAHICEDYRKLGVRIVDIDDSTPAQLRKQYVEQFKKGEIDIIVNVNIFSEGFDCPDIEFIQLARPTRSLAMYLQQVGRGLRVTEGKQKCLILDNVGMYTRFGLPDANRHWRAHFNGKEVDESPKRMGSFGGRFFYEGPDTSEDDEQMLLIQQSSEDDNQYEEENEIVESNINRPAESIEEEPKAERSVSPATESPRKTRSKQIEDKILVSETAIDNQWDIVAQGMFYYLRELSTSMGYSLCPFLRKPEEEDKLLIVNNGEEMEIRHYIHEIDEEHIIGRLIKTRTGFRFVQLVKDRERTIEIRI